MDHELISVAFVLGHISNFDRRLQRANLCVVDEPNSNMLIQGEKFLILSDSGAESFLVKESVSKKLVSKRLSNVHNLP